MLLVGFGKAPMRAGVTPAEVQRRCGAKGWDLVSAETMSSIMGW